ncbi:glycine-rich domain-containing protein [Hymenobacter sp. B81]|uniref:glycine-rich domain-containing protein n=1 Tax=Hymenobacter sp. B81 TaxID=3344878 RepID=UPI0037DD29BE
MPPEHLSLWQKIDAFELDDPQADLTFTDRLARENGWSLAFSLRAVAEYKRFMLLVCLAGHPLTPSDQVDQVWHLHLLYTRSYWDDFCRDTLGRPVHHGPTRGGAQQQAQFTDWYERTRQLYRQTFGQAPPLDLWPDGAERFGNGPFQLVNLGRYWLLPKFRLFRRF